MTRDFPGHAESPCMYRKGRCCTDPHPPVCKDPYPRRRSQGVPEDLFEWRGYRAVGSRTDIPGIFCTDSRCPIHKIKPETCRAGPITADVNGDPIGVLLKHDTFCPVARLRREIPEAGEHPFAVAAKRITRPVADLTVKELSRVCRIDGPETKKGAALPGGYHDHRH